MEMNGPPSGSSKQHLVLLVGTTVLVVLGGFAWTYYLERTACFDSAFFSWLMIDSGEPVSVLGRYGSWVAQLLPVALIRSGASLEAVLRSYSLMFIVFHALVFALLAFVLKDRKATYALPIVLTAGFHYMFYYGISELYQGLTLTLLLWAIIKKALAVEQRGGLWKWAVLAILLNVWISFYHQLLVLPLFFLLVFEGLTKDVRRRKRLLVIGSVLCLWYVLRIKAMASSTYEESRMPKLDDLLHYSMDLNALNSTVYFLAVWTKFKAALLLIAVAIGAAVWRRRWLHFAWTMAFSTGFLILVLIVDRDGMAPMIYENYYPVITLFWVVLLLDVVPGSSSRQTMVRSALLVSVCAIGLVQIHRGHYRISEKVAYAKRVARFQADHGSRKSIVGFDNYAWAYAMGHWPAGMESALVTAVAGPEKASTIFVTNDLAMLDTVHARPEQFLGPSWEPAWFGLQNLDQRYFRFPRDVGYSYANTWVPEFSIDELVTEGPNTPYRLVPDRFTVVPVMLLNPTEVRMPSLTESGVPCRMTYVLYRTDGTVYQESSILSGLESDIPPGAAYVQGLVIERPVDNGTYTVKARLEFGPDQVVDIPEFQVVADRWPF
jgi:hypothetical protein